MFLPHRRLTLERTIIGVLLTALVIMFLHDRRWMVIHRQDPTLEPSLQPDMDSQSRFAIVSMTTGETTFDYPAFSTKQSYATKHGYDILWDFSKARDHAKVWDKLEVILRAASATFARLKAYEWIWMVDYDVLITNSDITLEVLVERSLAYAEQAGKSRQDVHLILTKDCEPINAGVMFFRVSRYTVDFIKQWEALKDLHDEHGVAYNEQEVLWKMLADNTLGMADHSVIVPQTWFDAYPEELDKCRDSRDPASWDPSMFLVHFAGAEWFLKDKHQDPLRYLADTYYAKIVDND